MKKLQEASEFKIQSSSLPINQTISKSTNPIQSQSMLKQPISQSINSIQSQPMLNQPILNKTINQSMNLPMNKSISHFNIQNDQNNLSSQFPIALTSKDMSIHHKFYSQNQASKPFQTNLVNNKPNSINKTNFRQQQQTPLKKTYNQPVFNSNLYPKEQLSTHANSTHLNHTNTYNSFIFDRDSNRSTINFPENSIFNQSSSSSNGTNFYNGQLHNDLNLQNNFVDNTMKSNFDLTKLQIPTQTISKPNFKDFNAKPKLFVRC